jgi:hypothetical protein
MANDKDLLAEACEAFEQAADCESENRKAALEDLRFARLSEQWPDAWRQQREREGRPYLTVPKLMQPAAIVRAAPPPRTYDKEGIARPGAGSGLENLRGPCRRGCFDR